MVDIIGGSGPILPSGDGGRLGAHVAEVSPRLYLLRFDVIQRYVGIELTCTSGRWFGRSNYGVRVTHVSKNADSVLALLIGKAERGRKGDPLPACLQQLPEGETFDGSTTIGRSRYLLMFPTLKLTVGLDFKIVATKSDPTSYTLRATTPSNDPNRIMGELYALE